MNKLLPLLNFSLLSLGLISLSGCGEPPPADKEVPKRIQALQNMYNANHHSEHDMQVAWGRSHICEVIRESLNQHVLKHSPDALLFLVTDSAESTLNIIILGKDSGDAFVAVYGVLVHDPEFFRLTVSMLYLMDLKYMNYVTLEGETVRLLDLTQDDFRPL